MIGKKTSKNQLTLPQKAVDNGGYEASLERNKIFVVLPDKDAESDGYSSALERERRTRSVQFSSVSPFTRLNSAVLFVTSLRPRLRA